ncbi:tyrosine-type recombinase/integrase [Mycetohabitans sp. B5]|uniref:Phage integrase family protein n=1 Tax=Mycetohabitans endofungorum TaxID=417203 RepID=A0A2P5K6J2_9BURK|nr:tyrosine-type recombinase/integrase [Mycetohabitans sp. B5]PPB80666.1 phage integrase family protein [Mycetohabitans endofungorum]
MDWLHFHDLRHSAASQMINQRVDLYTVGAVLGHKSHASTQRYAHLATESLRDAITRIGQNFPHHKKRGLRDMRANPRRYWWASRESNTAPTDYESPGKFINIIKLHRDPFRNRN